MAAAEQLERVLRQPFLWIGFSVLDDTTGNTGCRRCPESQFHVSGPSNLGTNLESIDLGGIHTRVTIAF